MDNVHPAKKEIIPCGKSIQRLAHELNLSWCRALLALFALVLMAPCSALETGEWQVNAWGSVAPSVSFQRIEPSCSRDGVASSSFKVISRGNGDAEVTLPGVLEPNKAYRFNVWLRSNSPTSVDVFFRRNGFPYETTAIRSIKISGWTEVSLSGIHASTGRGSVRIAVRKENIALCINSATLVPSEFSAIGAQNIPRYIDPNFFGVHLNRLGVHNGWPTFDPGTLRLWDSGTTWSQLQPENSPIDWQKNPYAQRLDYYVKHGLSKHRNLQFIYTMGMTPSWAGSKHKKNCNNSSYGPSSCTKPIDLESWRQHVKTLGTRYKGLIRIWEIWNEADIWIHWDHTPEDLLPLVKIAAQELKAIDPANQIIGPNITGGGLRFLSHFLAVGGGAYLDGVSIHGYLGRVPELSLAQIRNVRQMLTDSGLGNMPIWNTETAVSCNTLLEDCKPLQLERESQKVLSGENSLAQGLIGNAALGVKSFVYYTWEGAALEYGNLPLVESNYRVPTKASLIFGTLKAWLSGSQVQYRTANRSGLNVVEVQKNNAKSLVLWSSGAPVTFTLEEFAVGDRYMYAGGGASHPLLSTQMEVGAEPVLVFKSQNTTTH